MFTSRQTLSDIVVKGYFYPVERQELLDLTTILPKDKKWNVWK